MKITKYSNSEVYAMALSVLDDIREVFPRLSHSSGVVKLYPVPRGGIPAAYAVLAAANSMQDGIVIVDRVEDCDAIIDDLIDSGATMERYEGKGAFFALLDKRKLSVETRNDWVVWPWEADEDAGLEDNIRRMLQFIGEDAERGGLLETPKRVAKAWKFWAKGYEESPAEVLKTFTDGAENADEMVIVKDIPFYTHCEHHMAPFFGTASIAYLPNRKIVGLSKLSRLLDIYARRLQVQERIGNQVADAIMEHLDAKGCGVVIEARHLCMESRGICKSGSTTSTSALRGVFKTDNSVKAEFLARVK